MANRYWVGGTGTWDSTTTTNWSATSSGTGGASVPTATDSVFFDQAGPYTVTLSGNIYSLDFTVSAANVTFTSASSTTTVYGSISFNATTTWASTSANTYIQTQGNTGGTITTNGVVLNNTTIYIGLTTTASTGIWTLGSALTVTYSSGGGSIGINAGTFDTAGYNVTCSVFSSNTTQTRTLYFRTSTITFGVNVSGDHFSFTSSGLTFNCGTSTLVQGVQGGTIRAPNQTFYNIISNTSSSLGLSQDMTVNNLTFLSISNGYRTLSVSGKLTINGTLSLSNSGTVNPRNRILVTGSQGNTNSYIVINSAPTLVDVDFKGTQVSGTAAPISGTRLGNQGNNSGITFSTPKTVYLYKTPGNTSYNDVYWATTSSGTTSDLNFPLPQDIAIIDNNSVSTGSTIFIDGVHVLPTLDLSSRTIPVTLTLQATTSIFGNLITRSGITHNVSATNYQLKFIGQQKTQSIICGGASIFPINIDAPGGTVILADAFSTFGDLGITRGTFDSAGYSITAGGNLYSNGIYSSTSAFRRIFFRSSTINLPYFGIDFNYTNKLLFDAGTSTINLNGASSNISNNDPTPLTFYNANYNYNAGTSALAYNIIGPLVFNNLTIQALTQSVGTILKHIIGDSLTVNGTLTFANTNATRRIQLLSSANNTQRTLTINAFNAGVSDVDFRDIKIAGAAANTSITRAGDCGNNSGITFPAAKTVYWNLAGNVSYSSTGWATTSGGTPDVNNFPLAQDTAIIDNTGSAGTLAIDAAWNIGNFDASARTSAMSLKLNSFSPVLYKDFKLGSGITTIYGQSYTSFQISGTGLQTFTSNGVTLNWNIYLYNTGTFKLNDALTMPQSVLSFNSGSSGSTFDANGYSVTVASFTDSYSNNLLMGSGTWTLTGSGAVWKSNSLSTIDSTAASIVLSGTTTTARTFTTGTNQYNKITIGGNTGISTTTFIGGGSSNIFIGELASTKTVAHTIAAQNGDVLNIGKWSVTGTAGNMVTVTMGTSNWSLKLIGDVPTGIDYITYGSNVFSIGIPFYIGPNSTNSVGYYNVYLSSTPVARTLYWVGGTGSWSDTTHWSASSGGTGGQAAPTALDSVIFNSASNATAYTVTIDSSAPKCNGFTVSGPASGNVTFANDNSTASVLFIAGSILVAATGVAGTVGSNCYLIGSGNNTISTGTVLFAATGLNLKSIGGTWTLTSALYSGAHTYYCGTFNTAGYAVIIAGMSGELAFYGSVYFWPQTKKTINLGASSFTFASSYSIAWTVPNNIYGTIFNAGTSTINFPYGAQYVDGGGLNYYNVIFTNGYASAHTIYGKNTFTNLTVATAVSSGTTGVGNGIRFYADQTITGTFTIKGNSITTRQFLYSDTANTQRTLTVNAFSADAANIDFQDIKIAGAAANISIPNAGDCGNNSGITFPAAKTVYWNLTGARTWNDTAWATTSGGTPALANFPLAQDTAVFDNTGAATTVTISSYWPIGTLNAVARTTAMTLSIGTVNTAVFGDFKLGTGTNTSFSSYINFAGKDKTHTIISNGKTIAGITTINPLTTIVLADNFTYGTAWSGFGDGTLTVGTYNVTGTSNTNFNGSPTINLGSGTWTTSSWSVSTNCTVNAGSSTLIVTGVTAPSFGGGSKIYNKIVFGTGSLANVTNSIGGDNTYAEIASTKTVAHTINFLTGTHKVGKWSISGSPNQLVTILGTVSSPVDSGLVYTGTTPSKINAKYLNIGIVAINSDYSSYGNTWYAGTSSTFTAGSATSGASIRGWEFTNNPDAGWGLNLFTFFS